MINITFLETEEEIRSAFPIMNQLREHLQEEEYLKLTLEIKNKHDYQLVALYDDGDMKAVIGFMPRLTLFNGPFIYVSDLVTDNDNRSNGYGRQLLAYIEKLSKEKGYHLISLSSGLQRRDAHRFYKDKMNYQQVSYKFRKSL
ncbi:MULTISPECIES: GNAT family N-acetyltransferase [Bacillus]|uniref:GNAT family N-acetyltransferase n=1 Tax=Bacillus TaxID=1386 RepID=UPI00031C9F03|nr:MULTISPECIES: GNAT family N-acetyltransferase [Bacillus]